MGYTYKFPSTSNLAERVVSIFLEKVLHLTVGVNQD